ncbi:hypothetical protein SORBI_3003G066250 [Sorghum bicolor]|uniref:Uncharacterized protein n=1 Tax=Sorghum bicolor TaxID=4558 RepID=A0A1W0VW10_SORBI|nr:hypothetical protein SORBI_3003G066250 [Sorghum bicolor]
MFKIWSLCYNDVRSLHKRCCQYSRSRKRRLPR